MLKKTYLSLAVALVVLGGWCAARAQEAKPLVTVAFSGYDEVKRDIAMIGELADNKELANGMESMLQMATGGEGLAGVDKTKPWGLVLQSKEEEFPAYGFIPVTDLPKLMELVGNFGLEAEDKGDGTYELATPGATVVVKSAGGWAFIGISAEAIAAVPTDPTSELGDLHTKYDIAVRGSVKNVPDQLKQSFISQMQMGVQMAAQRQPGETDEQYALRSNMTKQSMQQFITLVKDLDEITLGFAIDQQTKSAYLDMQMTAIPGTKTAEQLAAMSESKTNFAGFDLPGAAVVAQWAGTISDTDLAQSKTALKSFREATIKEIAGQGLEDADLATAKQILNDLFDVLDKTLDGRQMDFGMAVRLDPGAATVAAGGYVLETEKLEKILKQLVAEASKEVAEIADLVKFDAETYEGLRFHVANIPLPVDEDENLEQVAAHTGNPVEIVVAAGDKALYVAAGKDAGAMVKQIIDKSKAEPGKTIPPSRLVISATPIAKFVAAVAEDDPQVQGMATMIAGALEKSPGKDRVTVTSKVIPNGASVRLEIEEGILKLIPMLAPMGGPGGNF